MKFQGIVLLILIFFLLPLTGISQEEKEEEEQFYHHSIGIFLSHSYISQGRVNGDKQWLNAPSWALNYNYNFNENWSLGWHNDIIIEEFIVEDVREDNKLLERSFPFSTMLVGTYKPKENWGFALGGGVEFEENESFGLIRLGIEYGIPIPGPRLEVLFSLNYDILIDAYDSINFGIGIARPF